MEFCKKQQAWVIAGLLALAVGAWGQTAPGAKPQQATPAQTSTTATADFVTALVKAHNAFGYKLMEQACPASAPKNFIYSPAGTTILLDLTLAHSTGTIHDELAKALYLTGVSSDCIQPAVAALRQKIILAGVETKYRLSWTSPDGPTKMFRSFFTLEMYGTLDPPDQKSKPPWPFKLISSTRFVQRWEDVLEENGQITFYKLDGSNGTFPKLEREGEFSYFKGDGFQAVRLSYVGGDVYLAVYLPNDRTGLPDLLKKVYSPEWIKTSAKFMSERPGKVVLPSFRMGVNGSLREPLESMGVQTAFKQWAAYPGLFSNPSLLQSLDQKCKLEVTQKGTVIEEEGIEGGVEGGIMPENGPPPPPPFLMVVDHPFVFEIWDQTTGSLLFVGVVTDPEPLHVPVGGIKH